MLFTPPDAGFILAKDLGHITRELLVGTEGGVPHLIPKHEGAKREEVGVLRHGVIPLHPVSHAVVTEGTPGNIHCYHTTLFDKMYNDKLFVC